MGKRLTLAIVAGLVAALVCTAFALADARVKLIVGNVEVTISGGFSPKKLPKKKLAPIHLRAGGEIKTIDGSHPPALSQVIIETDRNGTINAKGLPKCTIGKLVARTTKQALKACKPALVGEGTTDVEIEYGEGHPFPVHSVLLAFNGGVRGGKTTILIHAYLSNPVSAAVVTTVKVTKVHHGRYGTKSVARIPLISGGYGSPIAFKLKFFRKFTYKHKRRSYLLARCADGKLKARAKATLNDYTGGTGAVTTPTGAITLPCRPRG